MLKYFMYQNNSYPTYLTSLELISELFIPRQERMIGTTETDRAYIHLNAIHYSPFEFTPEVYIGQKCMYAWEEKKSVSAVLLYPEKTWEWFPLDFVLNSLRQGKQQLQALSGSQLKFGNQSAGEVDFAKKKMGANTQALIFEYLLFMGENKTVIYLYITETTWKEINFRINPRHAKPKSFPELLENITVTIGSHFTGSELFPWRFPEWLVYLSQPEREKVINQLIGKKMIDFEAIARIISHRPDLKTVFETTLSQSNKIKLQKSLRSAEPESSMDREELFRHFRLSAGELIFHEDIILPTLDDYYSIMERGKFFMNMETLNQKTFDQWIEEIPVIEMEQTVMDLDNRTIATAFVLEDYHPDTEQTILSFLSPQGKEIHRQEKEQRLNAGIGQHEIFSARMSLIQHYLDRKSGNAFLIIKGKWIQDIEWDWWLNSIQNASGIRRVYAQIGYRQWKDMFLGIPDLTSKQNLLQGIPDDVRIAIQEQSAKFPGKITPTQDDHAFKARWNAVQATVDLSVRQLITLEKDRIDKINLAAKEGYRIKSGRGKG